jgi:D-glycero-alpha-D-manno-heptose-7-phosphate kinase
MKLRGIVDHGRSILESGDLDDFGRMLNEAWMLKRELAAGVSNSGIDAIYEKALQHGALGGKLLGAGGTGFMAFYVPPERRAGLVRELDQWPQVPINFETGGSKLLLAAAA